MNRLQPGHTIGTCEIEAFIGEGGMASVYRARQTLMERAVALKVLRPKFIQDSNALAGFLKEGMAGARLTHPSIAQVYYTAEENGLYYMVMEFVAGKDLKSILKESGPLPVHRALDVGRHVAEVLSFSHARGIVHREIKPGNIMIRNDGSVVLTDFGIADLLSEDSLDPKKGETSGTPAFMSPEQFRGEVADGRADLYSLGATLFNLLTGSPPFRGSVKTIMHKVLHERPPSVRDAAPKVPRKTATIITRLLAKNPDARYQTAQDVIIVLDEALSEKSSLKSMPAISKEFVWRQSFWWPALLSVAGVLVFAMCLFFAMSWAAPSFADRDEVARGGEGVSETPKKPPTERVPVNVQTLEERIELLEDSITGGRLQGTLALVEPTRKGHPKLVNSLLSLKQSMDSLPSNTRSSYAIVSREKDRAHILLVFGDPASGKVLRVHVTWARDDITGVWYILPDRSQTLRFSSGN